MKRRTLLLALSLLGCAPTPADHVQLPPLDVGMEARDLASLTLNVVVTAPVEAAPKMTALFSPHGGCTASLVAMIGLAKVRVRVQAYSFTSKPVISALADAHARGIDVSVILDRSDVGTPGLQALVDAKVPVSIDAIHAIAHNKVLVVDGTRVETGSFNYTGQAETSNAENCLFITNTPLAASYEANWNAHAAHSTAP